MWISLSSNIKQKLSTISVLLIFCLILFFRNPMLFTYPVPHGEDLGIFLGQEYSIGFPDTALILYAGYVHLLPRIIAWISLKFEWPHAMMVMNLSVLSIKVITFYLIYKSEDIKSVFVKFAILAYLILMPWADEIYNNVTNLQWWLIPLMLLIVIRRERSVTCLLLSCCVLFLSGLTGVNSIIFVVPCIYLLFKLKTKACLIKSTIIIICACIQLYYLLTSPRMGKIAYSYIFEHGYEFIINLINLFANRIIYQTLFNFTTTSYINIFAVILYTAAITFNIYYYRKNLIVRFICLFAIFYFISILYSLLKMKPNLEFYATKFTRGGVSCERYFIFLRICSFVLLVSTLNTIFRICLIRKYYKKFMAYSCFCLCLVLLKYYPIGIQSFQVRSLYYADIEKIELAKAGDLVTIHNTVNCGPKAKRRAWVCYDLIKK